MIPKGLEAEPPLLSEARHLVRAYPSHGRPFTELTNQFLEHRLNLGITVQTGAQSNSKGMALCLPHLGALGRFGNQILQYGFGRLIAIHCNADLIFPEWAGSRVFNDSFPQPVQTTYQVCSGVIDADSVSPEYICSSMREGHALQVTGYFGRYANHFPNSAAQFRSHFSYRTEIKNLLLCSLEADGLTSNRYAALHVRRGDFVGNRAGPSF